MASIRESEKKCPFYCAVTNTFGMYWGKVRVEGDKPNQKAWRIAYIPLMHAKKSMFKATRSNVNPKKYVELTKVKYPDSGVMWPFSPHSEPHWEDQKGRFNQVCLAYETTNDDETVLDDIEEFNLKKNSELERENRALKQKIDHAEIEGLELEHKQDESDSNPRSNRQQNMHDERPEEWDV